MEKLSNQVVLLCCTKRLELSAHFEASELFEVGYKSDGFFPGDPPVLMWMMGGRGGRTENEQGGRRELDKEKQLGTHFYKKYR